MSFLKNVEKEMGDNYRKARISLAVGIIFGVLSILVYPLNLGYLVTIPYAINPELSSYSSFLPFVYFVLSPIFLIYGLVKLAKRNKKTKDERISELERKLKDENKDD